VQAGAGWCRLVKSFTRLGQGSYWLMHGMFMLVLLVQTGAGLVKGSARQWQGCYRLLHGLFMLLLLVQTGAGLVKGSAIGARLLQAGARLVYVVAASTDWCRTVVGLVQGCCRADARQVHDGAAISNDWLRPMKAGAGVADGRRMVQGLNWAG
jgi:hypothetical protein